MGRSKAGLNHVCYEEKLDPETSKYYSSHRRYGGMCEPALRSHAAAVKRVQRRKEAERSKKVLEGMAVRWESIHDLLEQHRKEDEALILHGSLEQQRKETS